jgi:hypothetical protein
VTPTIARLSFTARNVGRSDHLIMDVRTFTSGNDLRGVTIGRVTTTGSPSGLAHVDDSLAVNGDAAFLAIRVWFAGHHVPICDPSAASGSGCTIVSVPQPGVESPAVTLGGTTIAVNQPATATSPSATVPSTGASTGATTPSTTPTTVTRAAASFTPSGAPAP